MNYNQEHKFSHFRMRTADGSIDPRAGATVANQEKDGKLYCAAAYCSPRDNFNYAAGRLKSSKRLDNFLLRPNREDKNVYFTFPITDGNIADAVRAVRAFMVEGLGYQPRYISE